MMSNYKKIIVFLFIIGCYVRVGGMDYPVGKKGKNFPTAQFCKRTFEIRDQNVITLLHAIESQNMGLIKKYAPLVNLAETPCVFIISNELMRAGQSPVRRQRYGEILTFINTLKEKQEKR